MMERYFRKIVCRRIMHVSTSKSCYRHTAMVQGPRDRLCDITIYHTVTNITLKMREAKQMP